MAKRKSSGFTIIEVALVLAIAGLIFLVVFLAVPALQRNQRNDAVKRDIGLIATAVSSYSSNNNGLATDSTDLEPYYNDSELSGNTTDVEVGDYSDATQGTIVVVNDHRCDEAPSAAPVAASGRSAAVVGTLETAGGTESYCQNAS